MTSRHSWVVTAGGGDLPTAPRPDLDLRCHRRLRGAYTGGGALLRVVVPELDADGHSELIAARATEIIGLAPELTPMVPLAPQTLTHMANRAERTRFYPVTRTLRISHGIAEMLAEWVAALRPGGVVIALRDVDQADPTDLQLITVLLRRCDPAVVRLVVETDGMPDDPDLIEALSVYADRAAAPPRDESPIASDADRAQLYIDSDGTAKAHRDAYDALPADERARRHDARAAHLKARAEPGSELGAVLWHLEHGSDPLLAGDAFNEAVEECFDRGFYEWTLDLSRRGRLLYGDARPMKYWNLTAKVGACLSYMYRGAEGFAYFAEMRAGSINPEIHMSSSYMMAMLYTRHLPKGDHDEFRAMEWVNTAIAFADRHPEQHRRVFVGAFMRNAKALVELHRADPQAALDLVNEAIAMTDEDLGPDEQLLHRSVLLYNRAQILAVMGDHAGSLRDYDTVITRDPDYGDYHFERANGRRTAGRYEDALADYAEAIRLSPPFHEAHYNRADLFREIGDDDAALRDLDYAIELEPTHVDSRVNRVDLLLAQGEIERAAADVARGLELDPKNANLLSAQGALREEAGDPEGAFASYTAALEQDPTFVAAWANRAILAFSLGRTAEAVDDLDQAIALGDDAALRANRAIALQEIGEHGRALEDLDIAVDALGADDPDLFYRRGASRYAAADVDGALDDWRAHLAAYGEETSPFLADIRLRAGDRIASEAAR